MNFSQADLPKLVLDAEGYPRDECGVFGVIGPENAAMMTAHGLHALQHRGQDACGIATFKGTKIDEIPKERVSLGLVEKVFSNPKKLRSMKGTISVGHVRYATQGKKKNTHAIQPFSTITSAGSFSLAHNGQFTNSLEIRQKSLQKNYSFRSDSDSEAVVGAISTSKADSLIERIKSGVKCMRGAYALVLATPRYLIGIRDPNGIRPLVLGKLTHEGGYVLASESCALDIVNAKMVRDIIPGEMVIITKDGFHSHFAAGKDAKPRTCVFEYVYFARPDSVVDGRSIYEARFNLGQQMAEQELEKHGGKSLADLVISVPDSGNPAAMGFAKAMGLDYVMGIIRNHYVGRSFIESSPEMRTTKVRMKHNANRGVLAGKRVYVIDDSLVRGNTSRNIVEMLKNAGAKEVHFRISCPQIEHSCIYGIDLPNDDKLISRQHNRCLASIRHDLRMDSVDFLDLSRLYVGLGIKEPRNPEKPQLTDHYFTGFYPVPQEENLEHARKEDSQLSLELNVRD